MDWPFSDPKELEVMTTKPVLEGKEPILFVSHDVDDGGWQFHSGPDFDDEAVCTATLGQVLELDASIAKVSELTLGTSAWRDAAGESWTIEPMFPSEWEELVADAVEYTQEIQEDVKEEFELGRYDQWDYFPDEAVFEWSVTEEVMVQARMRIIGAYATETQAWTWSWADATVPELAKDGISRVRTFGELNNFAKLVEGTWRGEEADAWQVSCVTGLLMGAEYVYRAPIENGFLFLILDDLAWADEEEGEDDSSSRS